MHDSWDALRDALVGINGSTGGYWYSFSADSVLDVLTLPGEGGSWFADPYLCIPFLEESETFEEQDERGVRCISTHRIHGFVRDTREDPAETNTPLLISRLRDDIVRLILTDHTLGGLVHTARLVSGVYISRTEDVDYGEIEMTVEITQVVDLNDIGSAA